MDFSDAILDVSDALERVILERAGCDRIFTVDGALKRKSNVQDEAILNRIVPQTWCHWLLPMRMLATTPLIGDELVDAGGVRWMIHAIQEFGVNKFWKCISYTYKFAFELDDFVGIFKHEPVKNEDGTLENRWILRVSGIPVKYGRDTVTGGFVGNSANGVTPNVKKSRIIVTKNNVEVEHADRFRFPAGAIYRIVRHYVPNRHNEWIEIELETSDLS